MKTARFAVWIVAVGHGLSFFESNVASDAPPVAWAGAIAIVQPNAWVHTIVAAAVSPADDGGASVSMVCQDTHPTDDVACTLDVFRSGINEPIASANSTASHERVSMVTATIPRAAFEGARVATFRAVMGVNHDPGASSLATTVWVVEK